MDDDLEAKARVSDPAPCRCGAFPALYGNPGDPAERPVRVSCECGLSASPIDKWWNKQAAVERWNALQDALRGEAPWPPGGRWRHG